MKLRTTHNSIRIRIRKSEITQLEKQGIVEESVNLGNHTLFRFALSVHKGVDAVTAHLENNFLEIRLPDTTAHQWIHSNEVGIEVHQSVSSSEQLHLLIEKDFPCLDRPNEDKSDTFWELAEKPEKC